MITIIKTKTVNFPIALMDKCIDYRYLGINDFGDHYHEINTRLRPSTIKAVSKTHPHIMEFAFDVDAAVSIDHNRRDYNLIYQELYPSAIG